MTSGVDADSLICHGCRMQVWLESTLFKGRQGDRIRTAAMESGWVDGENGGYEAGDATGSLSFLSLPCAPKSGFVTVVLKDLCLPEAAVMSEKGLLEEHDTPGFCPEGTTLIAGELLARPGETENQLLERIMAEWNWWMDLRASSKEMAVSWGVPPNKDLLFLLNRLDAGFLDESPQRPLAAGKVSRLVGFHPSTVLFGRAAGVPVIGPSQGDRTLLMTTWALGTEAFWTGLLLNNTKRPGR